MGQTLEKPNTEKYNESNVGPGIRYGLASMQGFRMSMEDNHSVVIGIPELGEHVSWFSVFDGHNGSKVSAYCSSHLLESIVSVDEFKQTVIKENKLPHDKFKKKIESSLVTGFLKLDKKLLKAPEVLSTTGYVVGGTTAIGVIISEKYIIFSNCGDSRGVLSGKTGDGEKNAVSKPKLATIDHKPSNTTEEKRIKKAGGYVMKDRVNGHLAVSRVFGDFEYKNIKGKDPKKQLVTPEPDIYIKVRQTEIDEFVVLACDGVWDVMSNEEIVSFVSDRMKVTDDLETICNEVLDTCLHKGSHDNMSIIIIAFPAAPKIDQEAKTKHEALNTLLEQRVTNIVKEGCSNIPTEYKIFLENGSLEFNEIFRMLSEEEFSYLPLGGGLHSKKQRMLETFESLHAKNEDDPRSTIQSLPDNMNANSS
jgi:serine/threonine protein phosphatase PrpC